MTAPLPILDTFTPGGVLLDFQAASKSEALECIVRHAVVSRTLPARRRDEVLEVLVEREERGSTAFGGGVAIPHARIAGLRRPVGLVARSTQGVDFRSVDGELVYVFVVLVSPESRSDEHLATLRWISMAARDPDFVSFMRQAQSAEDVVDVLHERAP